MAPPSKNFTVQPDSQVDADSPLDATLMTEQRDNDIHLEEWLGKNYTAAVDHDHDGTNSKLTATVADAGITQAKLSTAQGEVSTATTTPGATLTLPGGEYGFYPRTKESATSAGSAHIVSTGNVSNSYVTRITLIAFSGTMFAQQRYMQASPPYILGDTVWGHFLFLLRNIGTSEIVSTYQAEDPPWAYNGKVWLPKDHKDRIAEVPHPFADYWDKDPATDGLEIVLVNLSSVDVATWRADNEKVGKSILEDLGSVITGKGIDKPWSDYTVPTIPKFTDKVKVITP